MGWAEASVSAMFVRHGSDKPAPALRSAVSSGDQSLGNGVAHRPVNECNRLISPTDYCSFAYSALASFRMGMSGSASFIVDSDLAELRICSHTVSLPIAIR